MARLNRVFDGGIMYNSQLKGSQGTAQVDAVLNLRKFEV
jgi:hypothetical protein